MKGCFHHPNMHLDLGDQENKPIITIANPRGMAKHLWFVYTIRRKATGLLIVGTLMYVPFVV
jgi:hypothetical protein